ncbi:MAG: hypothetical protein M1819_006595 [Sarea resinae]|nr:MAG: hypothetical protein M1819_006595 [Sarea resinae]
MDDDQLTESDDDLEITSVVKRELGGHSGDNAAKADVLGRTDFEDGSSSERSQESRRPAHAAGAKVEWSDDDDPQLAYATFKNRKSVKRKREAASKKKAQPRSNGSGVGKRVKKGPEVTESKTKHFGDKSDDDDLMEYTLPDYLQDRRKRFEANKERMKEAGLKLPPDYDDIEFSDDESLEHLKEKPQLPAKPCAPYEDIPLPHSLGLIPAPIAQWLRDYQVDGVAFLHELFIYQKGGILGDDMGLGKTIQVIAFLTAAFGKTGDERDVKRMRKIRRAGGRRWYPRVLIVCPGSLIENWKAEFRRWGFWHVDAYHDKEKGAALEAATSGRTEIMITTYTTYRLNKSSINLIEWDCVIADECHIIKERASGITQSMNEINALCRIGLTGTAIQNKYEELWTLLNWTNPGRFGPISTWRTSICEPLKIGQSHDATVYQLSKARKTAKKLVENLLPEFFLRRMKTLIADQLPKKTDRVVFCALTKTQAEAYERYLDSDVVDCIKTHSDPCQCGSGKKSGWCCRTHTESGVPWRHMVFPAMMNLQKLANHLAILIPIGTEQREKQQKDLETLQTCMPDRWQDLYHNRDSILNYSNAEFCGKWRVLRKLLRFWHSNGDKVLVFSHSVRLLKMLQVLFNHTSYNVSYLDGSMSLSDRVKAVDDFNSDPRQFVFLISIRSGGVGLNITSANKVVVVDPNWNPSHDLQAQDRAYRIGQIRDVEVFRLVSAGTIEEIVYARQIYKQQQANIGYNASSERRYFKGVQEDSGRKGEIFGLLNMFSYQGDNVVLRDIVNKTNVAESKAGVAVVDVDMDDAANDEENETVLSQLQALVDEGEGVVNTAAVDSSKDDASFSPTTGGGGGGSFHSSSSSNSKYNSKGKKSPRTADVVEAILASAGVEYTHSNSEVIGSSRVEAQLSRRAEEAGNDIDMGEEVVFADGDGDANSNTNPDAVTTTATIAADQTHHSPNDDNAPFNAPFNATTKPKAKPTRLHHLYHPPPAVSKRQFCTMARAFGFASATEFALVVEAYTPAQRSNCLDLFYRRRRDRIGGSGKRDEDVNWVEATAAAAGEEA